jgi:GDP-6-deoxy-D-talose 4-dehydrogenase
LGRTTADLHRAALQLHWTGHGEQFLIPKLVQAFRETAPDASFVAPDIVRDFSDVRWVASVYVALLESRMPNTAVNVCSGIGTPLAGLVDLLERLTRRKARARPPAMQGIRSQLVGSPATLRGLGIAASPYSLGETLQWMLDA